MASLRRAALRSLEARSAPVQVRHATFPNESYKAESRNQREGKAPNVSRDAVYAAHGGEGTKSDVTKQRRAHTMPESGGFQPGQAGEQTSGHGPGQGEKVGGTSEAASPHKLDSLRQKMGLSSSNQRRHLHMSARMLTNTDPSKLRGEQNEHLIHSEADKPDRMPAVRDNAALPSKQGSGEQKAGAGQHPMAGKEPGGYGSAPQGLAGRSDGELKRSLHTSAFTLTEATRASSEGLPDYASASYSAPPSQSHITPARGSSRDQFKRVYVRGKPEPNSYRLGYTLVDYTTPEAFQAPLPTSAVLHSSTSTEPANPNTTTGDLENNDLKLPPDFDTAVRGKWQQRIDEEKELPPAGTEASGGTRELREAPRGPRDAPETVEKEQATSAPPSDAAKVAKTQEARAKGADPASVTGGADSEEAKPAHPEDVLQPDQPRTTLSQSHKAKRARSGPNKAKKA